MVISKPGLVLMLNPKMQNTLDARKNNGLVSFSQTDRRDQIFLTEGGQHSTDSQWDSTGNWLKHQHFSGGVGSGISGDPLTVQGREADRWPVSETCHEVPSPPPPQTFLGNLGFSHQTDRCISRDQAGVLPGQIKTGMGEQSRIWATDWRAAEKQLLVVSRATQVKLKVKVLLVVCWN